LCDQTSLGKNMKDYYVYVYIDPRNFEEFYYGKGIGSRKDAHLYDQGENPKTKRITEIRNAGTEPIIRVIARELTEAEALLVEATLLWKLGKFTTNMMSGHFSEKFRPHDTMQKEISGFDFKNRLYYFNVGEGDHRKWEDCRNLNFISAGQGDRWKDAICGFRQGDIFAAYLKGRGFVGIGRIAQEARMIQEVFIGNQSLLVMRPFMQHEYVATVEWIRQVPANEAKMKRKAGIYTTTHVRASLDGQPITVEFLSQAFSVNFKDILI
jgi:hypothetical protein